MQLKDKIGHVTGINGAIVAVHVPDLSRTVSVHASTLAPVQPGVDDRVKVLHGGDVGRIGVLLSIDNKEGVVKADDGGDVLLLPLHSLAKMLDDDD